MSWPLAVRATPVRPSRITSTPICRTRREPPVQPSRRRLAQEVEELVARTTPTLACTATLTPDCHLDAPQSKPRSIMTHHVSVLVAGTFLRYFTSACVHLIAPMTRQGHSVDYYTVLTTGQVRRCGSGL